MADEPNKPATTGTPDSPETPAAAGFVFSDIADEIPANSKNPDAERMAQFDTAIRNLAPGKTIGFPVAAEQSARGAVLLFSRAATRVYGKDQKIIDCGSYVKDGKTFAYARRKPETNKEAGK